MLLQKSLRAEDESKISHKWYRNFLNLWWQNSFANLVYTQIIKHLTKLRWVFKHSCFLVTSRRAPRNLNDHIFRGMIPSVLPKYFTLTCIYRANYELHKVPTGIRVLRVFATPHCGCFLKLKFPRSFLQWKLSTLPLAFITYNYIYTWSSFAQTHFSFLWKSLKNTLYSDKIWGCWSS